MVNKTLIQEFPQVIEKIYKKPLKHFTVPFSSSNLRKLKKISNIHSSSFQNVVFFVHNNFEMDILMDEFKESNPEEIGKLDLEKIERIYVQFFAALETSKSMKFDFIDFSQFQILDDYHLRFPIHLSEKGEFPLKRAIDLFRKNKNFKDLSEKNHRDFFSNISSRYQFNKNRYYMYRLGDFSSNMLNSHPASDFRSDSNIKIKIKTANEIENEVVKLNLCNIFFSDDILFLNFDAKSDSLCSLIAELCQKKHGCDQDNFIKVIETFRFYLKRSSFKSVVLIADHLKAREDIEFIRYLLDSAGISNLTFIYFGDKDFINFDLVFRENPVNLFRKYLRFEDIKKKGDLTDGEKGVLKIIHCLPFSIPRNDLSKVFSHKEQEIIKQLITKEYLNVISGKIERGIHFSTFCHTATEAEEKEILKSTIRSFDLLSLKIKYYIKTDQPEVLKNILLKFIWNGLEGDFPNIKKIIRDNWYFFEGDIELIVLYLEMLIKENDLNSAKEMALKYKNKNPVLMNIKLSHIFWLERDYQRMDEILKKVKKTIPGDLIDEFNFLKFSYFEKISDLKKADQYQKKIKNEVFVKLSNIRISDRYIYDGHHEKAEVLINNTINYFASKRFYKYELEARSQLAKLMREREAFKEAEELYKNLYLQSEIKNYQLLSAHILVDLGNLNLVQDNFNEAEFWYKKALKIFKGEGNENGVVLSESNLVEVNKVKGDWRETERYLKSIMKYDREKNLTVSWGIDYFNIAHLRYLKYDFSKALRYIEKAVVLFRKGNQLTGIVECEFLKTMIYMINRSYRVDLSFLKKNLRILTSDQRIVLSIIGACKKNGLNESISSTIEKVKKITSVTLQYELMSILVKRYRIFECLDFLKSLSMRLSKKTKNFYYYDFYYLYFDIFFDDKKDDEDQRKIFYDMYYFFLRNKRKMSSKIIHLKKYLDDKDSISDIFKSFELVGDYIHWKIPEDFFKSLVDELGKIIKVDWIKLIIFEKEKRVLNFSTQNKYHQLAEEIVSRVVGSLDNLNLDLRDIKKMYKTEEKAFYPYNNTKVILWKISESLTGVLLMAFLTEDYFDYDFSERNRDLLLKFASLISKYYENDYKLNKRLGFIVGESVTIKKLKEQILKISKVDFSVLIEGESGSGKELVAKAIHLLSNREAKPFIPVNSAAIPENLLEAELFGYKKGAFTGASEGKTGLIETADGGTLFLDEIADLPMSLQAKLLRILQDGEIRRLGENRSIKVNVRLISATHTELKELIQNNRFREDLFFRIQDLSIKVPPLRDRVEDIPLLTEYFLKKNGFQIKDKMEFQSIVEYLKGRDWRGNVRELESSIKRLITYYPDFEMEDNIVCGSDSGLIPARENLEKTMIYKILRENNWNKVKTAKALKISRVYLFNLMKKYHITRDT